MSGRWKEEDSSVVQSIVYAINTIGLEIVKYPYNNHFIDNKWLVQHGTQQSFLIH